ncbi:MAG: hypothetical protein EA350_01475 [Gemmatimonadales bacterium]|nr:MAG: hypothetical protein EA350_01475 [Gemmatimonadales bacterium]
MRSLSVPLLALSALLVIGAPVGLVAQGAVTRVEENVRFEPQGLIVGQLQAGTQVRVESTEGPWSRITFEGLVWENSLQRREGGAFDLIVSAEEGENLRAEPAGRIIGRLNSGTLLNEISRGGGWIRVRRTAWMWSASLTATEGATPPATPTAPRTAAAPAPAPAPAPAATAAPAPARAPAESADAAGSDWVRAGDRGTSVLTAPDGDTMVVARQGAELRVTAREGNWARVRVEGWVWLPSTESAAGAGGRPDVILRGLTAATIAREPERYRGRLVSLTLQHISLEEAESVRTDFRVGEAFILARSVEGDRMFVYVAFPPEQLDEVRRLQPLERMEVVGRVRTGAAALTGNPVLDLVDFRRLR